MCEKSYSVGRYIKISAFPEWMSNALRNLVYVSVFSFRRIKRYGVLISSENDKKSKCNCSHFVKYIDSGTKHNGSVKTFVKVTSCSCTEKCVCSGRFLALISRYQCSHAFKTTNPPHTIRHIQECEKTEIIDCVEVDAIENLCFHINVNNSMYLCKPLNRVDMYD